MMETDQRDPLGDVGNVAADLATSQLPKPGSKLPRFASKIGRPASRLPAPTKQEDMPGKRRGGGSSEQLAVPEAQNKKAKLSTSLSDTSLAIKPPAGPTGRAASGTQKPKPAAATMSRRPAPQTTRPAVASRGGAGRGVTRGATRGVTSTRANIRRSISVPNINKASSTMRPSRTAASSTAASKKTSAATAPSTASNCLPVGGKKRAAWDVKGRLLDMEEAFASHMKKNADLQEQITDTSGRIQQLESLNAHLEGKTTVANREIDQLQEDLRKSRRELEESTRSFSRQVEELEEDKSGLVRQKRGIELELDGERQQVAGLKATVAAQAGLQVELSATKESLDSALRAGRMKDAEIAQLKAVIEAHEATEEQLEGKIRENETVRRQLHNTIQELKGNIRVFCRVRPLLGDELLGGTGEIHHIHFPDEDGKVLELEKLAGVDPNESAMSMRKPSANGHYEFSFDKVFNPQSQQAQVFEEISQLVQSALDGYNVCIFAYGQTGSGKTHTMEGPMNPGPEDVGMIPRAVQQVFNCANELEAKGWKYDFEVSFLEIYNETIRDLLGNGKEDVKHEIKMVTANSTEVDVTNLTKHPVTHPEQVHKLLRTAGENRAVAETKCNERSSRSHSVFRLRISGKNSVTDECCLGLMNLIDLAGSERLKDSKSEGQRLKETQSINKSLANLGNVIMALANKDNFVPYRNSKLTHLLQNCLGGNSKVLMFVNVSPKEECFGETLNSLRFATKVNNCNIGTASKRQK